MRYQKVSSLTGKTNEMDLDITPDQLIAWQTASDDDPKRFVQNAFPHLTDTEREFLITGVTEEEWNTLMPPDPEDHPGAYDDVDNEDWAGQ